ncbi:MAG TPA: LysR family transcriptional regulator [Usitatibacter sp.]|jgi:LysR family transcriptional regulator, nitrogen assimilation regulatory protein|nr:LysR family transcriptional regulator [Usitatibacter sp.]
MEHASSPPISLRQLRYLVAVSDAGSFSAASLRTHVAQPALSRQIAMLEASVGACLLQRSRKGVILTESGLRLYGIARGMLERLSHVHAEITSGQDVASGVVTIALPPSVASMLVPKVVRELERHHPLVELRVEDGSRLENGRSLQAASIDFGVVPIGAALADVDYDLLLRESLLLVERRNGGAAGRATVSFAQAARLRLALPPRTFHTRRVIDEAARATGLSLDVAYEQHSVTTIVSLVREGLAATITNSPAVEQLFRPGTVRARRIVNPAITRLVALARPSNRPLGLAAQVTYDIVRRFALDAVKDGHWQGKAAK